MNQLKDDKAPLILRIRGQLFLGFGILTLILVIATSFVLMKVTATDDITKEAIDVDMTAYYTTFNLTLQLTQAQSNLRAWLLTHDPKNKKEFFEAWNNIHKLQDSIDTFQSRLNKTDSFPRWKEVVPLLKQLEAAQLKISNTVTNDNHDDLIQYWKTDVIPIGEQLLTILIGPLTEAGDREGGTLDLQYDKLKGATGLIIDNIAIIRITVYLLIIFSILVSFFTAIVIARRIFTPLNNAIGIAKKIASGERHIDISITQRDETGELLEALAMMQNAIKENEDKLQLSEVKAHELVEKIVKTARAFSQHSSLVSAGDLRTRLEIIGDDTMASLGGDLNKMTDGLSAMTKQISDASHHMVSIIEQVGRSMEVQSSGAMEQASSINEITSSLGQIEKSSAQTMEKARSLGHSAEHTREKGQQGLEAVVESARGMRAVREKVQTIAHTILELSNQTQQVGEITAVVNNLAQQSKMLALNASIEAAKAGEAGKGFAVVAIEVKNLAEQSEESTTLVRKILENIRHATEKAVMMTEEGTKGVDEGVEQVEHTGEIVRALNEVIMETAIASQQIEAAVHQESVGIEQIATGMNEINQVTAAFLESVKQTTDAIESLADTANSLKRYIDIYQI